MKKTIIFWGISLMLIVATGLHAQLFNASKAYVIKTVVPVAFTGDYDDFAIGDTALWAGNSGPYAWKGDAICPVLNSRFNGTNSTFLWTITPSGSAPYTYKIKNNLKGAIQFYLGAAYSMYLEGGGGVDFTVTATTDGNGKTCYNVKNSGNIYLSDVIDTRPWNAPIGCINTTAANPSAPYPLIYIYEAPSPPATTQEKAPLLAAIQSATTTYNASVVGSALGQFTAPNKSTLNSAISTAQAVYDSPISSLIGVNSALTTLQTATSAFKNSVIANTNALSDGLYYIVINDGTTDYYLTDDGISTQTTKFKAFVESDTKQQFKFTRETNTRYKIQGKNRLDNSVSRNYVAESGVFGVNAYDAGWNSMTVSYNGTMYAIQRGGSSGTAFWSPTSYAVNATINSTTTTDNFVFNIIAVPIDFKPLILAQLNISNPIYNASVAGTALGQYTALSRSTFSSAIASAQAVYDNPSATLTDGNNAISALESATLTFKNSVIVDNHALADGLYYIVINNGATDYYLTDDGTSTQTTKFKAMVASDAKQYFQFTWNASQSRYKIQGKDRLINSISRNSVNESGVFGENAYDAAWNSMTVSYNGTNYAIQRGGASGTAFWSPTSYAVNATINSTTTTSNISDNLVFNIISSATPVSISSNANISGISNPLLSNITVSGTGSTLTVDAATTVNSITVAPGAKLSLSSGNTLTAINGITLQSDATGTATLVDNTTEAPQAVTATVKQYVEAGRNWYMSVPLASGASSLLNKGTSVACYDEPSGTWIAPAAGTLNKLRGYVQVATSTPTVTGTTGTVEFAGVVNTGAHSISLTRSVGKTGFNLVGNPYPSYLDWNMVTRTNILPTMWFRTKEGGVYKFYTFVANGSAGVGSPASITNKIPPMQAFWVRVDTEGTGSIAVDNNMRFHKDVTGNIMKAPSQTPQKLLRLQVSSGVNTDETVLYFNANASDNFDKFDAQKRRNGEPSVPEIYTQVNAEQLVINGMNTVKYNTEIPIGFSTDQANDFSISANEVTNFEAGTKIILLDKQNPTIETELTSETVYHFSAPITAPSTGRFSLLFRAPGTVNGINNVEKLNAQIFVNAANKITIIASEKCNYAIYNAVGQKQFEDKLTSTKVTINSMLGAGIYFVSLTINGQSEVQKVIIR